MSTQAFMSDNEIASIQKDLMDMPIGNRIAFWAERFIGTPYDPDPLGEYVIKRLIVSDERVDCMYLTFRSVELALSNSPDEAERIALDLRFITKGMVSENKKVLNYDERFQYAEDMIESGKWGTEITGMLGKTTLIAGSRGKDIVKLIPKEEIGNATEGLKSGDIVFFIKLPEERLVAEIVGHMGIIKREADRVYLIHASGNKGLQKGSNTVGEVKKVLVLEYIKEMPFIGIRVSRLP